MGWDELASGMLGATLASFGSTCVYTHASGGLTQTIQGIFESKYLSIDPLSGQTVQSNEPTLAVRLSDLTNEPAKGDTVLVKSINYKVLKMEKDGATGALLFLQKV